MPKRSLARTPAFTFVSVLMLAVGIGLSIYMFGAINAFALKPLLEQMSPAGIRWLVAGGLCYTLGAVVYLFKRVKYHHALWHLAVLAGGACHYFAILWHVLP